MAIKPKNLKPFTVQWAAAQLGVSVPVVYKFVAQGKLRTYKIGLKGRRVSEEAVRDCIRALEAETAVAEVRSA